MKFNSNSGRTLFMTFIKSRGIIIIVMVFGLVAQLDRAQAF